MGQIVCGGVPRGDAGARLCALGRVLSVALLLAFASESAAGPAVSTDPGAGVPAARDAVDAGAGAVSLGELRRTPDSLDPRPARVPQSDRQPPLEPQERPASAVTPAQPPAGTPNEAEREAERAEAERRAALEAASRATSEALRLVNQEQARLLEVAQRQAEFEGRLLAEQRALAARNETMLAFRRRVHDAVSDEAAPVVFDELYAELGTTLNGARSLLAQALTRAGNQESDVPFPGESQLAGLGVQVDQSRLQNERARVMQRALELSGEERRWGEARAEQLLAEVETLNRLRLQLLPGLTPDQRNRVLGFSPEGWDQAVAEARQVVITLRYHLHAAYAWFQAVREPGPRRSESAWVALRVGLQLILAAAAFRWWRRRADLILTAALTQLRERQLRKRDLSLAKPMGERLVIFLQRVRGPLELLLFTLAVIALLPLPIQQLLEVRVLESILLWVFGSMLVVLCIDALSSEEVRNTLLPFGATPSGALRLRSLRLVAYAIVGFSLLLRISDLVVGQGTIHSWVVASRWLASVPIVLLLVAWWRPIIVERCAHLGKRSVVGSWVLEQRSGAGRFVAALVGGGLLFGLGVQRATRGWIFRFTLTRRLLVHLFRRDLDKQAQKSNRLAYGELPAPLFAALGPESRATAFLDAGESPAAERRMQHVVGTGGHVLAVVGERGSGRSTLVSQLAKQTAAFFQVECPAGGLAEFSAQLSRALELPPGTSLETAAAHLDGTDGKPVLLIDDAHQLVRPRMGGLKDFDRVLAVCRRYSSRCDWIFVFNLGVWRFLESARETRPLFDEVIRLRPWQEEEIVRLLIQRSQSLGIQPNFEHLLNGLPEDADETDRADAVRRIEANYYRLVWDYAAGNPGVALHFWRRSLGMDGGGAVRVRLFEAPAAEDLDGLPDSTVFVLRAILRLGWSNAEEISEVTSLNADCVSDALRFGNRRGYLECREQRYRITWDWYRAVALFLERRHLLGARL